MMEPDGSHQIAQRSRFSVAGKAANAGCSALLPLYLLLGSDQLTDTQHLQISANAMPGPAALVPLDALTRR